MAPLHRQRWETVRLPCAYWQTSMSKMLPHLPLFHPIDLSLFCADCALYRGGNWNLVPPSCGLVQHLTIEVLTGPDRLQLGWLWRHRICAAYDFPCNGSVWRCLVAGSGRVTTRHCKSGVLTPYLFSKSSHVAANGKMFPTILEPSFPKSYQLTDWFSFATDLVSLIACSWEGLWVHLQYNT